MTGLSEMDNGLAEILPDIIAGRTGRVFAWLNEHVTSRDDETVLLATLPLVAAQGLKQMPGAPELMPGGWAAVRLPDDTEQSSQVAGQMITAALNRDDDILVTLAESVADWPDGRSWFVVSCLLASVEAIGQALRTGRRWKKKRGIR